MKTSIFILLSLFVSSVCFGKTREEFLENENNSRFEFGSRTLWIPHPPSFVRVSYTNYSKEFKSIFKKQANIRDFEHYFDLPNAIILASGEKPTSTNSAYAYTMMVGESILASKEVIDLVKKQIRSSINNPESSVFTNVQKLFSKITKDALNQGLLDKEVLDYIRQYEIVRYPIHRDFDDHFSYSEASMNQDNSCLFTTQSTLLLKQKILYLTVNTEKSLEHSRNVSRRWIDSIKSEN